MSELFLVYVPVDGTQSKMYVTDNWKMKMLAVEAEGKDFLHLVGDFVDLGPSYNPLNAIWVEKLKTNNFTVVLAVPEQHANIMKAYQTARDLQRMKYWTESLKGLTETFFEKSLPADVKQILERSPEAVAGVQKIVTDGISTLMKKFGK